MFLYRHFDSSGSQFRPTRYDLQEKNLLFRTLVGKEAVPRSPEDPVMAWDNSDGGSPEDAARPVGAFRYAGAIRAMPKSNGQARGVPGHRADPPALDR